MPGALRADSVGPVDVAVVAFDGNTFSGDVASAMADLQASGVVRVIDLAFVRKDADGRVSAVELADREVAEVYGQIADPRFDLLREEDISELTGALRPGSSALVVVWENTWAARFASAVGRSRGTVTAFERIPFDRVRQALAALES
ncbi:MAG TPA: DUF6325 family protein [Streptosporangiaceae bacterium]|nr:DUF6325 family protein [Streptosporangiaceae bacterium]